ncbi:MAG: DUF2249 domain-containing protein [Actinobacteria bacterium]|nr:DUF2249 domain-containing protein [Actinomycetota bacterium]
MEKNMVSGETAGSRASTTHTTDIQAYDAILAHHRALVDGVTRRVEMLAKTVAADGNFQPVAAELIAYLTSDVSPHASAEERTLYQAAETVAGLDGTVSEMTEEHCLLANYIEQLTHASNGETSVVHASNINSLFSMHVDKENDELLPILRDSKKVDLAGLLHQMHHLMETADTNGDLQQDRELDVRNLVPATRHETIFAEYNALSPGESFILINDHDPKPLYYQFEAEHAGNYTWDYLETGPKVWRVRIGATGEIRTR